MKELIEMMQSPVSQLFIIIVGDEKLDRIEKCSKNNYYDCTDK